MKLMTHVVVGYPSLEKTKSLVTLMAKYADVIELQIPFSDPLADGPTIMRACEESLKTGTTVKEAFSLMGELSKKVSVPLLFMCYYNTVFQYGVEKFIADAKEVGCSGLIVPDMPLEEESTEHFYRLCKKYNMQVIFVVSPVTPDSRLEKISRVARGFVYATARQGITGSRKELDIQTVQFLKRVKEFFTIPVAVGFGISTAEQVQILQKYADIAVLGSAILERVQREENVKDFLEIISMVK